jgi:hypothetical protein
VAGVDHGALDLRVAELALRDLPLAKELLAEAIRIPEDHVERDPQCGLSNHEGPRLEYLKKRIVEVGAVRKPADVGFDAYGNLVWTVEDEDDGISRADKKVVYLDGHSDTVRALRPQWREKIGAGVDAYRGLVDLTNVDRGFLTRELGWLPPEEE